MHPEIFETLLRLAPSWWQSQEKPFFLYDEKILQGEISALRAFHQRVFLNCSIGNIYYSLKANPHPKLLSAINTEHFYFDVSSLAEFQGLQRLKVPPSRISYSGPNKSDRVLQTLLEARIGALHIDNGEEWDFLKNYLQANPGAKKVTRFSLRLPTENPMTHKLGMPRKDLERALQEAQERAIDFSGFHTYLGRESFDLKSVQAIIDRVYFWRTKHPEVFEDLHLYLGAGLPLLELLENRTQNSPCESPEKESLSECLDLSKFSQKLTLHLELGRSLVSACGVYAAPLLSVKSHRQEPLIIIDGGLQHLASKFSSPLYGEKGYSFKVVREGRGYQGPNSSDKNIEFSVYGSLGIAHDRLISLSLPPDIRRGDWILFAPCGAYGFTGATQQFLGLGDINEYYLSAPNLLTATASPGSYLTSWGRS